MERRDMIRSGIGLVGGTLLSGCLRSLGFEKESAWRDPPLVSDRPNAVYYPAVIEEMDMYGKSTADGLTVALMYSFPHRFWTVTGQDKNKVVVGEDDSLHLMVSVWDTETKTVLPMNIALEISNDDGMVTQLSPWPMHSPSMGFHYGDNVSLPGEDTYTATLRVGPLQTRRTGAFEGQFSDVTTATIDFQFDTSNTYDNIEIREVDGKAGERGSVELAMENMPAGRAPPKLELPGKMVGETMSGDAAFSTTRLDDASRFGEGTYLAISPRTPYNRIILPLMSLSATVTRDGTTVFDDILQETLDPELGHHYGANIENLKPGDTMKIMVDAPPQTARHDGYETAFFEMPSMEATI
ncbi:iron transporter [Natrinema sp. CBA1119]|uniref:iron transporter n=1 Tax=Natrinema sp. CBA1119 TaxID=1608465 RepID=UPI000BF4254D|nr:iron transporter [Natrinema sp. CBA1119]PGF14465.1 iron transporter [Natrinema sp. CBA1119]